MIPNVNTLFVKFDDGKETLLSPSEYAEWKTILAKFTLMGHTYETKEIPPEEAFEYLKANPNKGFWDYLWEIK